MRTAIANALRVEWDKPSCASLHGERGGGETGLARFHFFLRNIFLGFEVCGERAPGAHSRTAETQIPFGNDNRKQIRDC